MLYQPQYDLPGGRMTCVEALLRWHHPAYGDVPLPVLMAIVNRLSLHVLLFSLVVTKAIDVLCRLRRVAADVPVAVTAAAASVHSPGIARLLSNRMSRAGLPPRLLKIVMHEDVMTGEESRLLACLDTLREKGFPLSLELTGKNAAALAALSRMPFVEVSINAAFINDKQAHPFTVKAIALAASLDLTLLARGIDQDTLIMPLHNMGCNTGQGHALSCAVELEDFLKNRMVNAAA